MKWVFAAALVVAVMGGPVWAVAVLDSSFEQSPGTASASVGYDYPSDMYRRAQTFTSVSSGVLHSVSAYCEVGRFDSDLPLTLTILGVTAGEAPDETNVIGSTSIAAWPYAGAYDWRTFDFLGSGVQLTSDEMYALVFNTTGEEIYWIGGNWWDPASTNPVISTDPYTGGAGWTSLNGAGWVLSDNHNKDWWFRVYLDEPNADGVIPEPASFLLLGGGLLALYGRKRLRRRANQG